MLPLLRRLAGLIRRDRLDHELRDEMAHHMEMRRQQLVDDGMDPLEAAFEARRMFGNLSVIREETRDMWSFRSLETLTQDLRYGFRLMRRSPLVTCVGVLSLAIGIAASTAVIGVVNAALWRWSAMYQEPGRLAFLWQTRGAEIWSPTPADFRDWRDRATSFSGIEAYTYERLTFSGGGDPEQLRAAAVTPGVFATLGVRPLAGAGFSGDEETWGRHTRVLLSETLWRRRFGGDPSMVGRTLTLNGEPYQVAGVMPAGTWFTAANPDVFIPLAFAPGDPSNDRNSHFIWVIARLRDGVSFQDASAEMGVIARQLEAVHPANKGFGARPTPMSEQLLEAPTNTLTVVAGAVILVLLIACANVASLLLVRTATRERELAVRASLGASRGRVARQLLTEGVTLAVMGGAAGIGLAVIAAGALPAMLPANLPRIAETGIPMDWRVLGAAAIAVAACGLFIGILPAMTAGRWKTPDPLKESSRTASGGRRQARLRSALVCGEIALALMLVVGATLLLRSFTNLQCTELGVRTTNLVTIRVPLSPDRGDPANAAATSAYLDQLVDRARSVPGVLGADITSHVPLGGGGQAKHFFVAGQSLPRSYEEVPIVSLRQEGPDSLRTMGAALAGGRFFSDTDRAGTTPVAIVNRTLARRFFGASNPVGQVVCLEAPEHLAPPDSVKTAGGSFVRWTVVGVIEDIRYTHPSQPMESVVYVPHRQRTRQTLMGWAPDYLVLNTARGADLLPELRERLREVAPSQPLADVRTIEVLSADAFGEARVIAFALALFSAVALFLAAVGVYGAVAAAVTARTPEIGIRVALGAHPGRVVWLVLRQATVLAVLGMAAGTAAAFAGARALQSQLHGVSTADASSFALAPLVVCMATALAAWIPARRAARVDPVAALRNP
ncbi:MAG TPA: ABC transporter permease [Vicinamibacterales bacterium]|nr:ABC transporter permease [Vicinamibacterales bacterium]